MQHVFIYQSMSESQPDAIWHLRKTRSPSHKRSQRELNLKDKKMHQGNLISFWLSWGDVDMSGYPILLSQCPPGESHISPYLHKSFGTSHSLPRFLWAVSHGQNCRLSISKTCFQKGPWRYPTSGWMTQKNSQTSDTSLIILSLRRGNQRHKGLEVVSCKWPQTPRAKDAPNTGLGLPHWISFTPAPLGSQTCTFFTSAAQKPHPGKSGRRHGLDLCPGFHGNTGSCRRSSINLEHWLTELSMFPWQKETRSRAHSSTTNGRDHVPSGQRQVWSLWHPCSPPWQGPPHFGFHIVEYQ